jgi:hypothetical protein
MYDKKRKKMNLGGVSVPPGQMKVGKPNLVSNKGIRQRTRIGLEGNRKPIVPIKKDAMGRKGLMNGGRAVYNRGGYASVQDMEKAYMSKTGYNTMKIKGEK